MNVGKGILSKLIPLVVAGVAEISPRLSLPRFQLVCSVLMALLLGHMSPWFKGGLPVQAAYATCTNPMHTYQEDNSCCTPVHLCTAILNGIS